MATETGIGVFDILQERLAVRRNTFQDLLVGDLRPIERRLAIFEQRQNLILENGTGSNPTVQQSSETTSGVGDDAEASDMSPNEKVEIEVASPTEDQIRATNVVAEKHSDAEAVILSEDGNIEVQEASGGTFTLKVDTVLEREFDSGNPDTVSSMTPSMSEAVANKRGIKTGKE